MIWFTLKDMSRHFEIGYSTMRRYNSSGNTLDKRIVDILMLTYFTIQIKLTKNDLEHLKHFFKKNRGVIEEIKTEETIQLLNERYWQIDLEALQIAKELYFFNLSKEELESIYKIKKAGGRK